MRPPDQPASHMPLRSKQSAMRPDARPTLARRSPLKLSPIRQTAVNSGGIHNPVKLIRQQIHSRIRPEFGSAHLSDAVRSQQPQHAHCPVQPLATLFSKILKNSANRQLWGRNPYSLNSATSAIRIRTGTVPFLRSHFLRPFLSTFPNAAHYCSSFLNSRKYFAPSQSSAKAAKISFQTVLDRAPCFSTSASFFALMNSCNSHQRRSCMQNCMNSHGGHFICHESPND